jgi:thiol-disulfide isomerase/thioredoxin
MNLSRLIASLVFLSLSCNSFSAIDWNDKDVEWHGYVDGLLAAKKEKKNVVLIVYADWCGVCKKYSTMFQDADVIRNSKNVVLVKLNQDTDTMYLKKYSLDGEYVPRTYLLDSEFNVMPSPYKSKKYDFYLAPGNESYLASLLNKLKK